MLNIAVLVSGSGSNLQSIIDRINSGSINGVIKLVISNKKEAYGLKRAESSGIKSFYTEDESEIINTLKNEEIDLIVLAGFLKVLSKKFVNEFSGKIINIHPSLIPSFCGKGYYGKKVHEKVLEYGVKFTGATVHFVDENADTGPIILQEVVPVLGDDTVESLSKRVLQVEHKLLPKVVEMYCKGKIKTFGRKVVISE